VRLITKARIENFRSIESAELDAAELTALLGANGSGKSNILRALNLFFNGEPEPGLPPDIGRDYHRPWRKTPNKTVQVTVDFQLPDVFSIHSAVREPFKNLGIHTGASLSVRKQWTRDPVREDMVEETTSFKGEEDGEFRKLDVDESRLAARFLKLIHFRYIPNHLHPSELLKAESGALQEALIVALKRKRSTKDAPKVDADAFLEAMARSARNLVSPVNEVLAAAPGHVEGIALETPDDWAEVVWSLALRMEASDTRDLPAELHGSGSQTFLAYVLIAYLDTRFAQRFGWHQATIWAIEEPESFLHADLEKELSNFLSQQCGEDRFQGFLTTHEPLFAATAESRYEVRLTDGKTIVEPVTVAELADRTVAAGITQFVHPLNLTTIKPTLLVEGRFDVFYIDLAYSVAGRTNPWDIRSLDDIEPGLGGGKEKIRKYLAGNKGPLRARPSASPVIVLLDPDVSQGEINGLKQLLECHPTSTAARWPTDKVNPELDESVLGIERFLSTELFRATAETYPASGLYRTTEEPERFGIAKDKTSSAKQKLAKAGRDRGNADDLKLIIDLLPWLEQLLPSSTAPLAII
jgi:ABC-type thiamine transport system ATPase subunit